MVNVKCIVDDKNHVLCVSYSHKGGYYNSGCFHTTKLHEYLKLVADSLYEKDLFIIDNCDYRVEFFSFSTLQQCI